MVDYEIFEMPVGIEAAAFKADSMVKRDKTCPIGIFASGDHRPTVNFYNQDGSATAVSYFDGAWHKLVRLDG